MINKKLYLLVFCSLGLGQAFAMDLDSLGMDSDSLGQPESKIRTIEINIPGKGSVKAEMQKNEEVADLRSAVSEYLEKVKKDLADSIAKMNKSFETYQGKASTLQANSSDFRTSFSSKIVKFNDDRLQVAHLQNKIDMEIKSVITANSELYSAMGMFRQSDESTMIAAAKKINEELPMIAKDFERATVIAQGVIDEVGLFDDSAKANAAEEAARKAKKAEEAAAAAAAEAERKAEEEKTNAARAAATKAEAEAKAAKELAKKKEEAAIKIQMQYRKHKAEQLARKTQNVINKVASLRNIAQEQMAKFSTLINKIQSNTSMYPDQFIADINGRVVPMVQKIVEKFDGLIEAANTSKDKLVESEARQKELLGKMSVALVEHMKSGNKKLIKIDGDMEEIVRDLNVHSKLAANVLRQAEKYQEGLFGLYDTLQLAEQNARIISPEASANLLLLCYEAKIEHDKANMMGQERRRSAEQAKQQKAIGMLDLLFAVKAEKNLQVARLIELAYFIQAAH